MKKDLKKLLGFLIETGLIIVVVIFVVFSLAWLNHGKKPKPPELEFREEAIDNYFNSLPQDRVYVLPDYKYTPVTEESNAWQDVQTRLTNLEKRNGRKQR